ncbi:MAG: DUF4292 domain-containing protein [Acidobacteria bacterium]|nr:DUF4292 domain-containing protein [Acidobacteriota bacterium]
MRTLHIPACKNWGMLLSLAMVCLSLGNCAVQRREKLPPLAATPAWQKATLEQLVEKIQAQENSIQTLEAVVELQPSVTSLRTAEVLHYRDVRSFILIRKPALLRMIGQSPVVRSTAFDMASDGETFGLYIPSRNRFIMGKSQGGRRSESPLENLRPQHILDALLWKAPAKGREETVLEAVQEGDKAYYIVHVLRSAEEGRFLLSRKFWFERQKLTLERLQIFNETGEAVTDVHYSDYADFSGVAFARHIVLDRPQERFGLVLSVSQLKFNEPLPDDKFHLEKPAGAELINLEERSVAGKANDVG